MPQKKIRIRTCIQNRIITLIKEVPSRIELLYTVLQTVASPLGHGTIGVFAGAKLSSFFISRKFLGHKIRIFGIF